MTKTKESQKQEKKEIKQEVAAKPGIRKEQIGRVLSDRMTKTVVVECQRQYRHPQYMKVVRSFKKFYAHDEKQEAKKGDLVRIMATRPYSKLKRWRVMEVLEKSQQSGLEVSDVV